MEARSRGDIVSDRFVLQQTGLTDAGVTLAGNREDVEKLRRLQMKVNAWGTAATSETTGSLSASLQPCLKGRGTALDGMVSISNRTETEGSMMPLIHPYPARKRVDRIKADTGEDLPDCAAAPSR